MYVAAGVGAACVQTARAATKFATSASCRDRGTGCVQRRAMRRDLLGATFVKCFRVRSGHFKRLLLRIGVLIHTHDRIAAARDSLDLFRRCFSNCLLRSAGAQRGFHSAELLHFLEQCPDARG